MNTTYHADGTPAPRRVLGLGPLLAVAVGLVVSQGVMMLMLQGVGVAGLGFLIPLSMAFILAITYALSFSELALMVPRAGSLSSYTEVALGHFPAILSVFSGYIVVAMFALSAELLLLDLVVNEVYPGIFPNMSIAYGVLLLFTVLNLLGIDIFARLQSALALVMVLVLLTLGLTAITGSGVQAPPAELSLALSNGEWNPLGLGVLALAAMAVWGFVGAEFVCPLVEESKNPARNIPWSMIFGITIIFITIALYSTGALRYVPRDELANNVLPHYLFATAVLGTKGKLLLVVAATTATCSTVNSSLAAIPRMLYGMAQRGQAFPQFKMLSRRYREPWVAVLFVALITGAPVLLMGDDPDSIGLLLLSACIAWLLAYIICHLDVIVLRRRYPEMPRPFRSPLYPLPQIVGILGMGAAIYYISPSEDVTLRIFLSAGVVLGLVSAIGIFWVKFVMRKPLFTPEPIESLLTPQPSKENS